MKRTFFLVHDLARANAKRAIDEAPHGYTVTVAAPRKSRGQEAKYHAMIDDISGQYVHAGRKWDAENMKRLLVAAFKEDTKGDPDLAEEWEELGELELAPGIRGGYTLLGTQTRRFSKKLGSAFIEWLYAFGAEVDIRWSDAQRCAA